MTVKRPKFARAVTLIEAMAAMAILAVAAIGSLSYQYHAAAQSRLAQSQMVSTRIGKLLMEDWKSTGGATDYDPVALNLGFASVPVPANFTEGENLGAALNNEVYTITIDNISMLILLSWQNIDYDSVAKIRLRKLNIMMRKQESGQQNLGLPIMLTTYVRVDA